LIDSRTVATQIESEAKAAMRGDAKALDRLRQDLHSLNEGQLRSVAPILETEFGKSSNKLIAGVNVERDKSGNVTAITFEPALRDRFQYSAHSVQTSLETTNFVDNAERIFKQLDPDNTYITLNELSAAALDPRFKGVDAQTIDTLICLEQIDHSHEAAPARFPEGITRKDLEQIRANWKSYPEIEADMKAAEENMAKERTLFGRRGITPDAIKHGLGLDSTLEAQLAALAERDPQKIRSMIKDNGNNTYSVNWGGRTYNIELTDAEVGLGNRVSDSGVWANVLEAAWIRRLGLEGGSEPGFLATELPATFIMVKKAPSEVADFLSKAMKKKVPLVASPRALIDGKTGDGFDAQTYAVLNFDRLGSDGGTVTVYNSGGVQSGTPAGELRMSLETFMKNFSSLDYPLDQSTSDLWEHHGGSK
jgi:hypothetical protein